MRIRFNDKTLPVYIKTATISSEGIQTFTWATTYNIDIDLQPTSSDSTLKAYGLQKIDSRTGFVDSSALLPIGSVVVATDGNFEVVGIHDWYDHSEVIFNRYNGAL